MCPVHGLGCAHLHRPPFAPPTRCFLPHSRFPSSLQGHNSNSIPTPPKAFPPTTPHQAAPEKEVRRQRVGACWPQDAAATAPRGRWPKRAGPAPTSDIPPAHTRHEKQVPVPVFHQEGRTAGEEAIKRQTLCLPNTLNILKSLMAFDQPCLSRARPLNFREYQTWASKN